MGKRPKCYGTVQYGGHCITRCYKYRKCRAKHQTNLALGRIPVAVLVQNDAALVEYLEQREKGGELETPD